MSTSKFSVRWDEGSPIVGTPFRNLVAAEETRGAFSAQSAVMAPGELVVPHTHTREDEFSVLLEGRIGALVGDEEMEVLAGSVLKKPRGLMHAMWNGCRTRRRRSSTALRCADPRRAPGYRSCSPG